MDVVHGRRGRGRLAGRSIAAVFALVGSLALPAPASAQPSPVLEPSPSTVTADALPTAQIDGVVLAQVLVGNTVYAAGEFAHARPSGAAPGTQLVARSNLLAYDIRTGVLTPFAPKVNGRVKALAVSADGTTLFAGGSFTRVGSAVRNRFAAFSVATGGLRGMAPSVNGTVNALAVTSTRVYLGGSFTKVNTSARSRLAAVSSSSGVLRDWQPVADATVQALTATPDRKKIIAGGHFGTINGTRAYGLAAMDYLSGSRKRWLVNRVVRDWGPKSAILSLTADKDTVYGSGYAYRGGNFEGVFAVSPADGAIRWLQDCHGDTYSVAPVGGVVYSAGHAHYCANIGGFPDTSPRQYHHALAVTKAVGGTVATNGQPGAHYGNFGGQPAPSLFHWFPDFTTGTFTGLSQATWSVVGNSSYVAYGGEFGKVNGKPQQGLVRFAVPALAPRQQGAVDHRPETAPWVTATGTSGARVTWPANWGRDDVNLTYRVLRDGVPLTRTLVVSQFWNRPLLTWDDADLSVGTRYEYQVEVTDRDGNRWTSAVTPFRTSAYAATVRTDGPGHQWRLDGRPGGRTDPDQADGATLNLGAQVTLGSPGSLTGETSTGAAFSGAGAIGASTAVAEPATARSSVELGFRTSTAGGTLAAYGTGDSGQPTTRTRELYLTPTGRLAYAVRPGGAAGTAAVFVASSGPVTDGAWHLATAVETSGRILLYLDGELVAAKDSSVSVGTPGRWWVGGGTAADLPNASGSPYVGTLDEVATYPVPLSASQVAAHAAAARG